MRHAALVHWAKGRHAFGVFLYSNKFILKFENAQKFFTILLRNEQIPDFITVFFAPHRGGLRKAEQEVCRRVGGQLGR